MFPVLCLPCFGGSAGGARTASDGWMGPKVAIESVGLWTALPSACQPNVQRGLAWRRFPTSGPTRTIPKLKATEGLLGARHGGRHLHK